MRAIDLIGDALACAMLFAFGVAALRLAYAADMIVGVGP